MKNIDLVTLAHVTGGNLGSAHQTQRPWTSPLLPRPTTPTLPKPRPLEIPGFHPKFPPGSLDLPRRNDLA
jgi:hypothetical protein